VTLAIFDLDNTLIANDSDYLWGQFLVDKGVVEKDYYEQANTRFYQKYKDGTLNINEFLKFSLKPLADNSPDQLYEWRTQFIMDIITPILLKPAVELLEKHRKQGHTLLIITATNRFVTEPIAHLYGITQLLATTPEMIDGYYTGQIEGIPCFREGKVKQLEAWLKTANDSLEDSWFYSDSHNDLPLLRLVDHPVAVDPDDSLRAHAEHVGWPIISLREGKCPSHHFIK
jgi:HAD superfamily hydrolase (TIGR01490 family)